MDENIKKVLKIIFDNCKMMKDLSVTAEILNNVTYFLYRA